MNSIDLSIPIEYDIEYIGARQYKKPYVFIKTIAGISVSDMIENKRVSPLVIAILEIMHNDNDKINEDMEFAKEMIREER